MCILWRIINSRNWQWQMAMWLGLYWKIQTMQWNLSRLVLEMWLWLQLLLLWFSLSVFYCYNAFCVFYIGLTWSVNKAVYYAVRWIKRPLGVANMALKKIKPLVQWYFLEITKNCKILNFKKKAINLNFHRWVENGPSLRN